MTQKRTRSISPLPSQKAGLFFQRERLGRGWGWEEAHLQILEATRGDPDLQVAGEDGKIRGADVSAATLRGIENGRPENGSRQIRRMDVGELKALCLTYGVSADEVLGLKR